MNIKKHTNSYKSLVLIIAKLIIFIMLDYLKNLENIKYVIFEYIFNDENLNYFFIKYTRKMIQSR